MSDAEHITDGEHPPAAPPVIEGPAIEEPVIEEPVIEEPGIEEPGIDEPGIEEPGIERPVAAHQGTEPPASVTVTHDAEPPVPASSEPARIDDAVPEPPSPRRRGSAGWIVLLLLLLVAVGSGGASARWWLPLVQSGVRQPVTASTDQSTTPAPAAESATDPAPAGDLTPGGDPTPGSDPTPPGEAARAAPAQASQPPDQAAPAEPEPTPVSPPAPPATPQATPPSAPPSAPPSEAQSTPPAAAAPAPAAAPLSAEKPAPTGASDGDLAARLDRLDEAVSSLQESANGAGIKSDLDSLQQRVDTLSRKLDTTSQAIADAPPQLAAVNDSVRQLNDRLTEIAGRMGEQDAARAREIALALAAGELAIAVADGDSYAPVLETMHRISDSALAPQLAVLDGLAHADVPGRAKLEWELAQLAPHFATIDTGTPATGSFWHRTWLKIRNLVRVKRTADAPGPNGEPSPNKTVAAAGSELAAGDLNAAIQSMENLTGPPASVAASWLEEAHRRARLEQAAASVQATAITALGSGGSTTP